MHETIIQDVGHKPPVEEPMKRGNSRAQQIMRVWIIRILANQVNRIVSRPRRPGLFDVLFLVAVETIVLGALGLLANPSPKGDDALIHIQRIIDLARNFLQFQWDPRSFNGYAPSLGFAWSSYALPAFFVGIGLDPIIIFHVTFVGYFLVIGPSIYYCARTLGSQRTVALAVSVLGWSTIGYWGYVGGGAYGRVFTLPLMFIALALTYRYSSLQNSASAAGKAYWLLIAVWVSIFLGDVYISAAAVAVAVPFIALSAGWKGTQLGLFRLAKIFLPVLALTSWFWIPLAARVLQVGSPPSDLTLSPASQVFWVGPVFSVIAVIARRKTSAKPLGSEHAAILFSLNLVSIYFLIMGAITPIWDYLPRIWAAYDSFNILSFLFPLTVACIFVLLKPLRGGVLVRPLAVLLIIFIAANAIPTLHFSRPPDLNSLDTTFAQAFSENVLASDDYRISLQGRAFTHWFPFYYPDGLQTGGRVLGLDPSPFYQSWYQSETFFKDDLATLDTVYLEDQPTIDVTGLVADPQNFASTMFWLDWYGVGTLVLDPAFYPVEKTAQNFSQRGALFSTNNVRTAYGPLIFVNPIDPGPVLLATNATTIGFYSQQRDSVNQYNYILALLSYLGLDSRHIVPVYLSSLDNINPTEFNAIITDEYTYSQTNSKISSLERQGAKVVVVSSGFLAELQTKGLSETESLINLVSSIISPQIQNLTAISSSSRTIVLGPQDWTPGFSQNAQGTLRADQNNLTLTISVPDTANKAQFDIDVGLSNPIVLSSQLRISLEIKTNVESSIALVFTSSNFTSSSIAANQKVDPGQWLNLQIPYTNFTIWNTPQSRFATATRFSLNVTIPPGYPNATIQLGHVAISEPSQTLYQASDTVPLSATGFLQGPSPAGIVLSDETGALNGAYKAISPQSSTIIIPLAAFTSRANTTFTKAYFIGDDSGRSAAVALFKEPSWTPLESEWITNQDLKIQAAGGRFHGIVWKESFTSNWGILAKEESGGELSLRYYLAGPGLVYVPLNGLPLAGMNISYHDPIYGLLIPLLAASSLLPLVLFRRRIYPIGMTSTS